MDALREAIINSFCHRDYKSSQNNEVVIYSNRVEIYNPGAFPSGYTPQDFIEGIEPSVKRNPLIAQLMYYVKDIESFGTGLKRITDECGAAGVKVEFHMRKRGVAVVFYRPEDHNGDDIVDDNIFLSLTPGEKAFIESLLPYFAGCEWITNSTARELSRIPEGSVKRYFRILTDKKVFEAQGENKARQYRLRKRV